MRTLMKRTENEITMRVCDALRKQEDPLQRQRLLVEEERLKYLNEEELIIQQLQSVLLTSIITNITSTTQPPAVCHHRVPHTPIATLLKRRPIAIYFFTFIVTGQCKRHVGENDRFRSGINRKSDSNLCLSLWYTCLFMVSVQWPAALQDLPATHST